MARLLTFIALSSIACADTSSYFINPPASGSAFNFAGNLQFTTGSVIPLQWYSDISTYDINLWQQPMPSGPSSYAGTIVSYNGNGPGSITYNWTVNIFQTSLASSYVYYISADYPALTRVWSSHYFNVVAAQAQPSSSSTTSSSMSTSTTSQIAGSSTPQALSMSTSTSTSTTGSASMSTTQPAATTTAAVTADGNTQNTAATTVGLGVGLGIGIPLILILTAFLALKWHKDRRATAMHPTTMTYNPDVEDRHAWGAAAPQQQIYEAQAKYGPVEVVHEAPNTFGPYEASDGKRP